MDFEANGFVSKKDAESAVQQKGRDRATRVVKQQADPKKRPCSLFVHYSSCTCEWKKKGAAEAQAQTVVAEEEMDVEITGNVEEISM
jgi:hypothetical protein